MNHSAPIERRKPGQQPKQPARFVGLVPYYACAKCGINKPPSLFNKCSNSANGLVSRCRECTVADQRVKRLVVGPGPTRKLGRSKLRGGRRVYQCLKCLGWFLPTLMQVDRSTVRGFASRCKDCHAKITKTYRDKVLSTVWHPLSTVPLETRVLISCDEGVLSATAVRHESDSRLFFYPDPGNAETDQVFDVTAWMPLPEAHKP